MKQGTRHVTRRAFLASMAALGAVVPFARPSKSTAAVTPKRAKSAGTRTLALERRLSE